MNKNQQIAATIIEQLGGNVFKAMTGAKNFLCGEQEVSFHFPGSRKVNRCSIILNGSDLYDIKFSKYSPKKLISSVVSTSEMVYGDMLESVFTEHTGLYTSL